MSRLDEIENLDILVELDAVKDRVDKIYELAKWAILASQRFEVGDRVTFSPLAHRSGLTQRRRSQFGTVTAVSTHFSINVRLDGVKRATGWHHSCFQKVQEASA